MTDWEDAMRRIEAGEDVEQACERVSLVQQERVREMLREEGREDLVAELDANLKDARLGISGARSAWHSISSTQRRVLLLLSLGKNRRLVPASGSRTRYGMQGDPHAIGDVCGLPTVRNLHARSLIEALAANVFHYGLSERGRFVLNHGRSEAAP